MPAPDRELRADCARCCGLCCTGPAFDAAQGFGYDKPAHHPCRHLMPDHRCEIHADRQRHGFVSCGSFECFGAGQWVTQRIFRGKGWRDSPSQAARMFATYRRFLVLHELLAMIDLMQASRQHDEPTLSALRESVEAACRAEEQAPGSVELATLRTRVVSVLAQR